jgi:rRNA maturation endonuclease Nob1
MDALQGTSDGEANLRCGACGRLYYSAAAVAMIERGERCPRCGGELELLRPPSR